MFYKFMNPVPNANTDFFTIKDNSIYCDESGKYFCYKLKFYNSPVFVLNFYVHLGPWKIGIGICYDIRFPELSRCYEKAGEKHIINKENNFKLSNT